MSDWGQTRGGVTTAHRPPGGFRLPAATAQTRESSVLARPVVLRGAEPHAGICLLPMGRSWSVLSVLRRLPRGLGTPVVRA